MAEATGDLKVAPGVGGGEDRCAGADDVPDLADQELFGLLGLGNVIDAGAAAAPIGFGEFDEFQAGDQLKQGYGFLHDILDLKMAGIVVENFQRHLTKICVEFSLKMEIVKVFARID